MVDSNEELRRAAVLVASLDVGTADALLRDLPPEQSNQIRQQAASLKDLPEHEQRAIIADFLRQTKNDEGSKSQPEAGKHKPPSLPITSISREAVTLPKDAVTTDSPSAVRLNRLIDGVPIETVRDLVRDEQSQTIAFIIASLTPTRGARLLDSFHVDQQSSILERLAEIDRIQSDIVEDISAELVKRLDQFAKPSSGNHGKQVLAALCDVVRGEQRQRISQHLRDALPRSADGEPPRHVDAGRDGTRREGDEFVQLTQMDGVFLDTVFRRCKLDCVSNALAGLPLPATEQVLRKLPASTAELVRQHLAEMGPLRLSEIQQSKAELVRVARQLLGSEDFQIANRSGRIAFSA